MNDRPGCHHLGQRHAVPFALIKLAMEQVSVGNYEVVVYKSPGGGVCRAYPVVIDGEIRRVDFSTDEHED